MKNFKAKRKERKILHRFLSFDSSLSVFLRSGLIYKIKQAPLVIITKRMNYCEFERFLPANSPIVVNNVLKFLDFESSPGTYVDKCELKFIEEFSNLLRLQFYGFKIGDNA